MSDYDELAELCGLDRPTGNALIVAAREKINALRGTLLSVADTARAGLRDGPEEALSAINNAARNALEK